MSDRYFKVTSASIPPPTPACSVSDIYVVQVPGFVYYDLYMKVNNLPTSSSEVQQVGKVAIAGADSWNNLLFNLEGIYNSSGQTILKANQTLNGTAVNYILSRRSAIYPTSNGTLAINCAPLSSSAGVGLAPKATNVLGASTYHFTQELMRGAKGKEVSELQKYLQSHGYSAGPIDGIFGASLGRALVQFQTANNIWADGIVGPATRAILNK